MSGLKLVTVGSSERTLNKVTELAKPPDVVTKINPLVAPVGIKILI